MVKIRTPRDIADYLCAFLEHNDVETAWTDLTELSAWRPLTRAEKSIVAKTMNIRKHDYNGIDRRVYIYAIRRADKHFEYLIGTSREVRVRDMSYLRKPV